jgi:ferredoxin-NADP reductase
MKSNKFSGIVEHKQLLTSDIIHLRIGLVEPRTIEFFAGQYIRLDSKPYGDKPVVSRNFSLASAPARNQQIELIIRRNAAGICTPWIFDHLRNDETVTFSAPFGRFRLSDNLSPAIFIAGGSGMSALWGILQDVLDKKLERKIRFFFGARTQNDLYFIDSLSRLEKEHAWFSFIPAFPVNRKTPAGRENEAWSTRSSAAWSLMRQRTKPTSAARPA